MENALSTCLKNNIKNYPFKKAWKQKTRAIRMYMRLSRYSPLLPEGIILKVSKLVRLKNCFDFLKIYHFVNKNFSDLTQLPVDKFFEFANAYKYSKMFIFLQICRQKYDETI